MKRFRFPLEGVLRLRQQQMEVEQAALAKLLAELQTLGEHGARFARELHQSEMELQTAGRVLNGQVLSQADSYRRWAGAEQRRNEERKQILQARISAQQQRVLEARRRQELLLKLKARSSALWEREAAREEQALADEVFCSQWARSQEKSGL